MKRNRVFVGSSENTDGTPVEPMEPIEPKANRLALRVALLTMKERCVSLQRRINSLQDENRKLREVQIAPQLQESGNTAENVQLRLLQKLSDMERQKDQLTEHVNMISDENLTLWWRLSQMAKEQDKPQNSANDEDSHEEQPNSSRGGGANQNLIRSKTFTQHSPNPHLRRKLLADDITPVDRNDNTLEEVALEVNAYNDVNILSHDVEYAESAEEPLGFAYMNVSEENGDENFSLETKKYIEGLQEVRGVALQQQKRLSTVLKALEKRLTSPYSCPECAQQKPKKPEMADKSLETDDSLSEVKFLYKSINDQSGLQTRSTTSKTSTQLNGHTVANAAENISPKHINIIQEKIEADAMDKTCPMCGRVYGNCVTFDAFREHVEMHFVDDSLSDFDNSIDHNFEIISRTVGDF